MSKNFFESGWVVFSAWILDWEMSDIVKHETKLAWNLFPIS